MFKKKIEDWWMNFTNVSYLTQYITKYLNM